MGPYDHTVQKPSKGSVLAYWQAKEGLQAADSMKSSQQNAEAAVMAKERRHPPRRVDVSGTHVASLAADAEADQPSTVPEVCPCPF